MKKKLDIPKDFWKDFKDRKDFDDFFSDLFKEGVNQMLKAEMTDHLGYENTLRKETTAVTHVMGIIQRPLKQTWVR